MLAIQSTRQLDTYKALRALKQSLVDQSDDGVFSAIEKALEVVQWKGSRHNSRDDGDGGKAQQQKKEREVDDPWSDHMPGQFQQAINHATRLSLPYFLFFVHFLRLH